MTLTKNIISKNIDKIENKNKILETHYMTKNLFMTIKKIGSGSFGEVYTAVDKDGKYVAIKSEEKRKNSQQRILTENRIYQRLKHRGFIDGLPHVYMFIQTSDFNLLVMELLGPSLEDVFNICGRKFNLGTVLNLGCAFMVLMEKLHNTRYIHRDIKPNNFLIGMTDNIDKLYVMDFGLSKQYADPKNKHIEFNSNRSLIGTARYASINMHLGIEPTRRDDLESIGYMLIYFLNGVLPWQGIKKTDNKDHIEAIGDEKMCVSLKKLCANIPLCFKDYLQYCRNLKFDETPDYKYLYSVFADTQTALQLKPEFEWCVDEKKRSKILAMCNEKISE
jgi:serine/threonine protein kinase